MTPLWVITGAASGVGRSLAVSLAASGAEVILVARRRERLEDTATWCQGRAIVCPADLSDEESLTQLALTVARHADSRGLAGLVHAAGILTLSSPDTPLGWSRVPLVNAIAPWWLTRIWEPYLLATEAPRVLFVAGAPFTIPHSLPRIEDWHGAIPNRGMSLAVEAAAAKVVMARVLARSWAARGSAFAFHPGFVKSELADGLPLPLAKLGCLVQPFLAARSRTGEFLIHDKDVSRLSGTLVSGCRDSGAGPQDASPEQEEAWCRRLSQEMPSGLRRNFPTIG